MDKERFELFHNNLILDNEGSPSLLNIYQAMVRLNEFSNKIKELETKLKGDK